MEGNEMREMISGTTAQYTRRRRMERKAIVK